MRVTVTITPPTFFLEHTCDVKTGVYFKNGKESSPPFSWREKVVCVSSAFTMSDIFLRKDT